MSLIPYIAEMMIYYCRWRSSRRDPRKAYSTQSALLALPSPGDLNPSSPYPHPPLSGINKPLSDICALCPACTRRRWPCRYQRAQRIWRTIVLDRSAHSIARSSVHFVFWSVGPTTTIWNIYSKHERDQPTISGNDSRWNACNLRERSPQATHQI